jgi:hypothetical protein
MHPVKNFDHYFAEGCQRVEEFFELGREAKALVAIHEREREDARKAKRAYKKTKPPVLQIAQKYDICLSSVYSARKAAEAFSEQDVELVLEDLRKYNRIPGAEMFRIWASVPNEHQAAFVAQSIRQGWDVEELKQQKLERFNRRSNGGKKPDLPSDAGEALRQLAKARARLLAIHEAVVTRPVGADGPSLASRSQDWRQLDRCLQRLTRNVQGVDWNSQLDQQRPNG